jgi:hypothetical protein
VPEYAHAISALVSWKMIFFKKICVYLLLEKLVNKKYFSVKKNLAFFPEKCFFFYFE